MAFNSNEVDVIVVGGGLAGLTAAYQLKQIQPDCRVLVLEAKDRVGGRTLTVQMKGASGLDSWDVGGQWVCRSQHHIMWLMQELGIETYPQHTAGRKLLQVGNRGISSYSSNIPSLPLLSLLDMHWFLSKAEAMIQEIPPEDPRKAPDADELDNITLETLVNKHVWMSATKELIEITTAITSGANPREMSALYFLYYASMTGSFRELVEAEDGAGQEWKIRGGAQPLSISLVNKIGQENVLLGEPVERIDQTNEETVMVKTGTGKTFHCKFVIVAAPVHCAASITYLPKPPLTRIALANRMPVGHIFKFLVTYEKAFWKEKGYSGEVVSNGGKPMVQGFDSGPVQFVMDATSCNDNPALVGFYANSRQWREVKPEERKAALLNHLIEFFGPEAGEPLDFVEKDWGQEPYNGGCPVNIMTPGAISLYFDGLRTPFHRIHWAGTETGTHWAGFLNGAVQSGLRAADEVLDRFNPDHKPNNVLEQLDKRIRSRNYERQQLIHRMVFTGKVVLVVCITGYVIWGVRRAATKYSVLFKLAYWYLNKD